jgi:hypothetical protein
MLALTGYSNSFLKDYSSLRTKNPFATISANNGIMHRSIDARLLGQVLTNFCQQLARGCS